jgi:hypothetical protein
MSPASASMSMAVGSGNKGLDSAKDEALRSGEICCFEVLYKPDLSRLRTYNWDRVPKGRVRVDQHSPAILPDCAGTGGNSNQSREGTTEICAVKSK